MSMLGKFELSWEAFKAKTPANAKKLGNGLVAVGTFVTGTTFAIQKYEVAVGAAIATGLGKFLTEFFHDAETIASTVTSDQQKSSDGQTPPNQG